MNEILQKRIYEAAKRYADSLALPEWDKRSIHAIDFKKGAVTALQNQWISVGEALPPLTQTSGKVYLTIDKNGYADVKARNLDGWSSPRSWCSTEQITHWMNIPSLEGGE